MSGHEVVVLKGSRNGVAVIIDERASIEAAVRELRAKLANAGSFFRGAVFSLDAGARTLTQDERAALSSTMEEFGILLSDSSRISRRGALHEGAAGADHASGHAESGSSAESHGVGDTLLLRRTIRSGQRIEYPGNVVVMGDVNAGAVIMCSGDIIVLGSLRGVAHAGAEGDERAIVMAFRLQPTQLRIAHHISRAPDEAGPRPEGPEIARVRNGTIQLEMYVP